VTRRHLPRPGEVVALHVDEIDQLGGLAQIDIRIVLRSGGTEERQQVGFPRGLR
jgi:hypothetical protein